MAALKKRGGIELGIQTAQLLMDPRRHDRLRQSIQRRFPLLPAGAIDTCIDIAADAFRTVAPEKLRQALRPGGMDKVRPEIERAIVDVALRQKVVKDIPVLDVETKTRLLEAVVDVALDTLLEDAQEVLAAPEVRLEELEEQLREVKSMMGPWRLLLYRVRNNPVPVAAAVALSVVAVYLRREDPVVVAVASFVQGIGAKLAPAVAALARSFRWVVEFLWTKLSWTLAMLRSKVLSA